MFYTKEKIAEGMSLEVELTGEAFTRCPECGEEHEVDIIDLIRSDPDFDFYSVRVYCSECSNKRRNMVRTSQPPTT